jgi:hypothetical protein
MLGRKIPGAFARFERCALFSARGLSALALLALGVGACADAGAPARRERGNGAPPGSSDLIQDDGTRGTPLIGLGRSLTEAGECKAARAGRPPPARAGRPPLRRISRIEYDQAVFDLFGVDGEPAAGFVVDEKAPGGYASNTLTPISDLSAEQYLNAADAIAAEVVGEPESVTGCASADDASCIKSFLLASARRAFRGSFPEDEVAALSNAYDSALTDLGAEAALALGVQAILLSPRFLYVLEFGQGEESTVPLTGAEVAGRLAALIWRSVPDDTLLERADQGELDSAEGVMAEATRMLEDPRSDVMLGDFTRQWLDVESIATTAKDNMLWPDFTPSLSSALLTETEGFFRNVFWNSGRFPDLFAAEQTFANAEIAAFYGYESGTDEFGLVSLPPERLGVLSLGSVLAKHAHFARPSVVLRGKLVRTRLLCNPVNPPPANVDTSLDSLDAGQTEAELAAAHAADGVCNGCHKLMDPIGMGFSAFDGVGRYIGSDGETGLVEPPLLTNQDDVSGEFEGVSGLSQRLGQSQHVAECYAINVLRFALGREETPNDACSAAEIWSRFEASDFDLFELVLATTGSSTFRYRTRVEPGAACE